MCDSPRQKLSGGGQRRRTLSRSFPIVLRFQSLEMERMRKMIEKGGFFSFFLFFLLLFFFISYIRC